MEVRDKTIIHDYEHGGERRLDGIGKVDGYSPALSKVYEFHGDVYHGNPKVFSMASMSPIRHIPMGLLYLATVDREFRIKKAGFLYDEMWEGDWKRMKRACQIIQYAWRKYKQGVRFRKMHKYPRGD